MRIESPAECDGYFSPHGGFALYRSGFNVAWPRERGLNPKVIFDVGAYDGGDGVRLKQAFPAAKVISFEADPTRFTIVVGATKPFEVAAIHAAVSDSDGFTQWFEAKDHLSNAGKVGGQGSIYRQNDVLNEKFPFVEQSSLPITVPSMRLDTFCRGNGIAVIDILHMDVQGAEFDVLSGLGEIRPFMIYLEVEGDDGAGWIGAKGTREVDALLQSWDYEMAGDFVCNRLYVRKSVENVRSRTGALHGCPGG
jgi:2-O-methyltransferase